jgi:transposase
VPALPPYLIEPIWQQFKALLPVREVSHPLGCHRPRIPDRMVFEKLVQVLVFGCAYHRIADGRCSATTLRDRRNEWIESGVMDRLRESVLETYDRFIGLEVSEMAVDCCITKAPCGGEKAGSNPVDRGSKAPNALWPWTSEASLWAPSAPPPTATTHRCWLPPSMR